MNETYIAVATPFFFLLIVVELIVSRVQAKPRYRLRDSITNLSCGAGEQAILPFLKAATLGGYIVVYQYRLFSISSASVLGWVAILFGVDFFYYWFHRASHRVNFIWATHVVHHQSEEYNLAVALRQSWFYKLVEWVFYLPLAAFGFPPEMFLAMITINTIGQFWIHTRAVGKLGPLEWIINTPSSHRVHHGTNPKYVDKNYAGLFIVWDRMFGTFQAEEEEPVYGTVKPLASFNPLWANVHYWIELAQMAKAATSVGDKVKVWFAPPEWRPSNLGGHVTIPEASRETQRKYDVSPPRAINAYVAVQIGIAGAVITAMNQMHSRVPEAALAALTLIVLVGLVTLGALLEGKRWAAPLELTRLVALPPALGWLSAGTSLFAPVTAAACVSSVVFGAWVLVSPPARADAAAAATARPTSKS